MLSHLRIQSPFQTMTTPTQHERRSVVSDSLQSHGLYTVHGILKVRMRVSSLSLLQGIFLIQGLNPGLLHCRWIFYQLRHKGSPRTLECVAYPFSSRSSWPRNQSGVSSIAGRFFTNCAIREAPYLKAYNCKEGMTKDGNYTFCQIPSLFHSKSSSAFPLYYLTVLW